jgi:glycosyltransferase involved in cell wall biosynthesis
MVENVANMNVAEINIFEFGSTGKIMMQIAQKARLNNFSVYTVSNGWSGCKKNKTLRKEKNHLYVNNFVSYALHYKLGGCLGLNGFFSFFATLRLLFFLKKRKVQLIHLHNLHAFCFNIPLLFYFIKKYNIPVIWTLHDCWSFTGRCPYFELTKCNKWKEGCHNCPYPRKSYPVSYVDSSHMMWTLKSKWFNGVRNMTIVTPSMWLANLVKQSFLRNYPVKVIYNGIDRSVFRPVESDFRNHYGLIGKKIVLGVAFGWGVRKGLDVFVELSKRLSSNYRIVLVGTDEQVDLSLPDTILSIHRTNNQEDLAKIYTAANVFVNPTREDVLGMVNLESLACGTPVITFKTGGSTECIDEFSGAVVECDDVDALEFEIKKICEKGDGLRNACLKRARLFDVDDKFNEYIDLYTDMLLPVDGK